MQVSDILEDKGQRLVSTEESARLDEIAARLKKEAIGAVVILDPEGALRGIVSERDLVRAVAERGAAALEMTARDLMSTSVVTCSPESDTSEIMEQMLANHIRHLPVMEEGVLVGVISSNDVVKAVHGEMKWMAKVLQEQVVASAGWATDER